MWWKRHKWKVILPVIAVAVLAAAFWYGGDAPGLQGWTVPEDGGSASVSHSQMPQQTLEPAESGKPQAAEESAIPTPEESPVTPAEPSPSIEAERTQAPGAEQAEQSGPEEEESAGTQSAGGEETPSQAVEGDGDAEKDKYLTDTVPEGKPLPVEPQDAVISDTAYTCTISISCASILDHMDWLDEEKAELVPEDGWVLAPVEVTFYEGESVFNVLQRTCKQQKIHLEFENTPMYNSAYIEGIHNLYEFDCGELSGWMYEVNGWFPNYGCSRYQLRDGDVICWVYTCELGADVGRDDALDG